MQAETVPDWRDAAAYAPLLDADRSLLAWEWLRRDRRYRAAARQALSAPSTDAALLVPARSFGLVAFERPELAVPEARPLWRSEAHAYVLAAEAVAGAAAADHVELDSLGPLTRVVTCEATEHLLLSDGLRAIRLDGPQGTFASGPVCLRYSLHGLGSAEPPLVALRRFLALARTSRFSRSLHRREARARRWILMLRAHDASAAGADQREIASVLLSASADEPRWRGEAPSLRSQVQRLVRSARSMAAGGYRRLLL